MSPTSLPRRATGLLLGALTAAAMVTGTAVAPAASADPRPAFAHIKSPQVISFRSPTLYPEGVTWDPFRGAFLVSSARFGTVSVVRPNGAVTPLVTDHGLVGTFGMTVDVWRGRLLVAYADPQPTNQVSGLGIFDLATGKPIHLVNLKLGPGPHFANDVAVDPYGNAYVTDTTAGVIYQVNTAGKVTRTIKDPAFAPTGGFSVNGIVWHPRGFLLTVKNDTGQLFRVTRQGSVREVHLDKPITSGDGLALLPDGTLIAVTNSLAGRAPDAALFLRPIDRDWSGARHVRVQQWPDPVPTTVTVTPRGAYLLSGRLDLLLAGDFSADTFTLRRF